MPRIEGQIAIHRAIEEVFDFVADERNEPRYNGHMRSAEKVTNGPIGPGTEFRAQMVSMGRLLTMTTRFDEYERPHRLALTSRTGAMTVQGTLTFSSVPEGTLMRWSWDVDAEGFLKLLGPLMGAIGNRQERRIWTSLKQMMEEPA